jgi:hypothetical protein
MNSPRCARTLSKWLLERIDAFDHVLPSTADQTVMSGRISISFVDFAAFLFDFDGVRCVLMRLFLVRNWCGVSEA